MKPASVDQPRGRRPKAGNALIEFILTLPIVVFVTGLTIYMSMAMLTRQQTLVDARRVILNASNTDSGWSSMKLETWLPGLRSHLRGSLARGTSEDKEDGELDQLRREVEEQMPTSTWNANRLASEYWNGIWDNLPGRREVHTARAFTTKGRMWDFIEKTASADRWADTSPWYFHDLDTWQMARSGPLAEVFRAFYNNLQGPVAPHFQPTRDDIISHWWHYQPGRWPD